MSSHRRAAPQQHDGSLRLTWTFQVGRKRVVITEGVVIAAAALVFAAVLVSHVLILPPYEGFDETAHYSYISLLSDRHQIPDFRTTLLDASIEVNRGGLPGRYGGRPPYDSIQGVTYYQFFNQLSDSARRQAYQDYWCTSQPVRFRPGEDINWQGQHPPLYYLMMVVPYRLTAQGAPAVRILVLRLMSVLIACGSLFFWYRTIRLFTSGRAREMLIVGGVMVGFLPSLPFDLARMGNDSLVALLFSGVFYFLAASYVHKQRWLGGFWLLALMLALGLWTKAIFAPVLLGVAVATVWLAVRENGLSPRETAQRLLIIVGVPILCAAAWYVFYYGRYGLFLGGAEAFQIKQVALPFVVEVSSAQFALRLVRAVAAFTATFFWSGTWSLVHRPLWQYALVAPVVGLATAGLIRVWREKSPRDHRSLLMMAGAIMVPTIVALLYHLYVRVRLNGTGSQGYYLFSVWPALGIFWCFAAGGLRARLMKMATLVAFLLLLSFSVSGYWFEMEVYAGVVAKAGAVKSGVGAVLPTPSNLSLAINRLQYLACPVWALLSYSLAIVLQFLLAVVLIFGRTEELRDDSPSG